MSKDYPVPAGSLECETEIKKSRFIARVAPVASREDVRAVVEQAHRDHPDARHVCWAYQIGRPGAAAEAAMNDDGEPSGTAGKPILNVIQHKDMGDVLVVVIRYFGGIKLGAGGLVRAYASAAESVLSQVERVVQPVMTRVDIELPFASEQPVRHWCEHNGAEIGAVHYGAGLDGAGLTMAVQVSDTRLADFLGFCAAEKIDCRTDS
ncbi:YigZ family protein [Marinobacter sp. X15-166B]|uniref:YigZ family protein n=1 Tax=Marinobacter sp. X15-166B TaxID=1897620 RepID=UPI00085BF3EC|nr:YigZ family protein [Marinobacter sp. X15-166B]OEY65307.1 YigZ family protein [Marinobacter sp. X15-166B]